MLKFRTVFVLLVVGLFLVCCAQKDESAYDKITNQSETFHSINFQIPKLWEKDLNNEEELRYVQLSKENELITTLSFRLDNDMEFEKSAEDAWKAIKVAEKSGMNIENANKSDIFIADMPAMKMEYTENDAEKKLFSAAVFLKTENDNIVITFTSWNETREDDFQEILNSITKNNQGA